MVGILLTLLAVVIVICLAFAFTDHGARHSDTQFPEFDRTQKKKS